MSEVRGVVVSKRLGRTYRPELALAPGPQTLGQPGAGTFGELYGAAWALALYRGGPQLFQARAGVWVDRTDPDALGELVKGGVRHVSLAFDQAARPVLAWERDGAVYVRQWSAQLGQYVTRGPWAGHDPLLWWDMGGTLQAAGSDVVLFHLASDRLSLLYRLQSDLYEVPHAYHAFVASAVLDQVVTLPWSVELLGEAGGQSWALIAGLYPVHVADAARTGALAPTAGVLRSVVAVRDVGTDRLGTGALAPAAGEMGGAALLVAGRDGFTVPALAPTAGAYMLAVITHEVGADSTAATARAPLAGQYVLVVVTHSPPPDELTAGGLSPTGGNYV